MTIEIKVPTLGESVSEATVAKWLKKVGDNVKRDEPLFEISTDKVDAEIPSPSAGILVEILIGEGQTVAIQTVVARLETDAAAAAALPPAAPSAPAAAPASAPVTASVVTPAAPVVASAVPTARTAPAGSFEERVRTKSSPLVRKMAAAHGVEIAGMSGTGIAGRVTRKDLDAVLAAKPAASVTPAVGASMHAPAGIEARGPLPTPWAGDIVEPMSKIRKLTSDHMALAIKVATHVTSFFEIDLTRVARIRTAMRKEFEVQSGQKLTYLPFILQAVCAQLKRHPVLNAAVAGNDVILRKSINLGIAVALEPTGLIVPVLKNADELSLTGLARAQQEAEPGRRSGVHLHHHESRRVRLAVRHADHSRGDHRNPGARRDREAGEGRHRSGW